jgi:hypothetical protein
MKFFQAFKERCKKADTTLKKYCCFNGELPKPLRRLPTEPPPHCGGRRRSSDKELHDDSEDDSENGQEVSNLYGNIFFSYNFFLYVDTFLTWGIKLMN